MKPFKLPAYCMPGKAPAVMCDDQNPNAGTHQGRRCSRRQGHGGRHAFVWWDIDNRVRAVWGER